MPLKRMPWMASLKSSPGPKGLIPMGRLWQTGRYLVPHTSRPVSLWPIGVTPPVGRTVDLCPQSRP